jgi:hypothetical protein
VIARLAVVALVALSLVACGGTPVVDAGAPFWGEPIDADSPLTVAELLDRAAELDGQELAVAGTVTEVCQSKGCWMLLTDGDREMRVKFVDYGFFVPMDLTGEVLIEGTFSVETVSVKDARHYLEDAGKHEEAAAITEPQESFTFLASGVRRG